MAILAPMRGLSRARAEPVEDRPQSLSNRLNWSLAGTQDEIAEGRAYTDKCVCVGAKAVRNSHGGRGDREGASDIQTRGGLLFGNAHVDAQAHQSSGSVCPSA